MRRRARIAVVFVLVFHSLSWARAEQVSVEQMWRGSELVFEGRAVSITPIRPAGNDGPIFTRVSFEITDIIKGSHASRTIHLEFLGGTVGSLTLAVADMRPPAPGEFGIYFVESVRTRQVHPLFGWAQGHFIIRKGGSGETVTTVEGFPILAARPDGSVRSEASASAPQHAIARGISIAATRAASGLTPGEFKAQLRQIGQALR